MSNCKEIGCKFAGLFIVLFIFGRIGWAEESVVADPGAKKFLQSCAGCHSLTGVKLSGPDLSGVVNWPVTDLKTATKRMEKNVGPLTVSDIDALSNFLRDSNNRERIKTQEALITAQFSAKMDPPLASVGRDLFLGQAPLSNGGMACASCHQAAGVGGTLAPDLTRIHSKMGDAPLISAIEKANFKIMEPHYRLHTITKQEAIHLNKYLSTLDANQPESVEHIDIAWRGAAGAIAFLIGMAAFYRTRRQKGHDPLKKRRQ